MPNPVIETPLMDMPRLGLGTWPMTGTECTAAVESALGLGYRHIDTAARYGNEAEVGAGLAAGGVPRDQIFLTTKVWHEQLSPEGINTSLQTSLDKLRTPYVDLFLVHWPSATMDLPKVLETLAALRETGTARAVGVSNFPLGLLKRAVESEIVPLACLQVEYHLMLDQTPLLAYCRAKDMVLTAYCPLARGGLEDIPVIAEIARKHDATPAQIALAWLWAKPGVAAIPKAAGATRQKQNLDALHVKLSAADITALDALPKDKRFVNPEFAPDWAA